MSEINWEERYEFYKKITSAKIGSIIEYNGERGIITADSDCKNCCSCLLNNGRCDGYMHTAQGGMLPCCPWKREDRQRIYIKKEGTK